MNVCIACGCGCVNSQKSYISTPSSSSSSSLLLISSLSFTYSSASRMDEVRIHSLVTLELQENNNPRLFGKSIARWMLLSASSFSLVLGGSAATLLGRLYFVKGGSRRWLYTWNQTVAWPLLLLPLLITYRRQSLRPTPLTPKLLFVFSIMGFLVAFDNLLYSWGLSYLPASTNSLLCSSQLAFSAVFAFALTSRKISPFVLNSVVVITMGAVLLGIHASSDRPAGTSAKQYNLGFVVTIAASAIYALILTLTELIYKRVVGKSNFVVVLETQAFISGTATIFSMVGMFFAGDFASIRHEALHYELGPCKYTLILVWSAIGWQLFFLGSAGVIFVTSSLMACVLATVLIPVVPVLSIFFFHDNFSALKALSMLMCIWGFISYIYGGYLDSKKPQQEEKTSIEMQSTPLPL